MFTTIRIRKGYLAAAAVVLCLALVAGIYGKQHGGRFLSALIPGLPDEAEEQSADGGRIIDIVTGEFESTMKDGKMIEAYRWDPGTIFLEQGEPVTLRIRAVSGDSHPFLIEGLDVRGQVDKGETKSFTFTPQKEGIYRLICLTHANAAHDGPMIAYLVVD